MEDNDIIEKEPQRQRHGFVTFWLWYMVVNGVSSILAVTVLRKDFEHFIEIKFTDTFVNFQIIIGILTVLSSFLLLSWKKIGFHGIIIASIISLYLNMQMQSGITNALFGLSQIFILYLVLKLRKGDKSTWDWLT
ncbi:MAG: hypothetical protein LC105_10870 [Chitinophagales bacterium]|nr:hypothetical protein [Chitinophagales bacterium]MCZ2394352.1 hypothetical protein [Chitinophagales bacterium]